MRKIKIFIGVTFSIAAISVTIFFVLRYLVTKSFPEYTGTITVPSLRETVTVSRDEFGVPHIRAGNEYDLFFTQGYVHA